MVTELIDQQGKSERRTNKGEACKRSNLSKEERGKSRLHPSPHTRYFARVDPPTQFLPLPPTTNTRVKCQSLNVFRVKGTEQRQLSKGSESTDTCQQLSCVRQLCIVSCPRFWHQTFSTQSERVTLVKTLETSFFNSKIRLTCVLNATDMVAGPCSMLRRDSFSVKK